MNNVRRFFSLMLCFMMVFSMFPGAVAWGAAPANPWEGKIRPGFMTGSGDTDILFDMFFPVWGNQKNLLYFNPNLRFDNHSGNEQNFGIGYRGLFAGDKMILGVNFYYDRMKSKNNFNYEQVGFGLEVLSKWADMRANYYIPTGTRSNRLENLDTYEFGPRALLIRRGWEEAVKGFDAEIGVMAPFISDFVETRVYLGGYKFDSKKGDDISGTKYRVEMHPSKLITLNVEVKDDDINGTDTSIGGYLNIPFSAENLFKGKNPFDGLKDALAFGKGPRDMKERMVERVVRDRYIPTYEIAGKNSDTEKYADMIYVNQDHAAAGSGTLTDPYKDINSAPLDERYNDSGVYVYVFSNDSTADTYLTNLQLRDNMVLWGQGYYHPKFKLGGVNGSSFPSLNPILDGDNDGNVITLANNNEIMGFTIQNGNHGIYGENIARTYIHDNIIRNNYSVNGESGIHIENLFQADKLSGLNLAYNISNNEIHGNSSGIYLYTRVIGALSVSDLTINNIIANNLIHDNSGAGVSVVNYIEAPIIANADINNTFTGNTISNNDYVGVYIDNELYAWASNDGTVGGVLTADVTNSSINNTFTGNTISNSDYDEGVYIYNELFAGAYNDGTVEGDVTANITGSSINNTFTGNTISDNDYEGVYIYNYLSAWAYNDGTVGGVLTANVTNSSINNTFTGNTISNNGDAGVDINNYLFAEAYNGGTVGGDLTANVTGSSINNTFTGNTISNSDYDEGVYIDNYLSAEAYNDGTVGGDLTANVTGSSINNTFTDNTISNNGDEGVDINNELFAGAFNYYGGTVEGDMTANVTGSSINNTFTGNTISNNDYVGVYIDNELYAWASNDGTVGGVLTADVTNSSINNTFTGNTISNSDYDEGVYIYNELFAGAYNYDGTVEGDVTANVTNSSINNTFTGNDISNNDYVGVYIYNELFAGAYNYGGTGDLTANVTGSSINNTFTDNTISDNDYEGVYIYNYLSAWAYNGGTVGGDLTANVTGSSINNTFTGNTISNSDYDEGVYIDNYLSAWAYNDGTVGGDLTANVTGSSINNTFTDNTISNNGDEGIYLYNYTSAVGEEDVTVTVFMQGNKVIFNDYYGVYIYYDGDGVFIGDLGGGVLGSSGLNSFHGHVGHDLYNDTGVEIKAENNWWGADEDPDDQIDGAVDYTPWLTTAP